MSVIGLLIFIFIAFFFLRFVFRVFGHLFKVFGWIGEDINKTVTLTYGTVSKKVAEKSQEIKAEAEKKREQELARKIEKLPADGLDDEEPEDDFAIDAAEKKISAGTVVGSSAEESELSGEPQAVMALPDKLTGAAIGAAYAIVMSLVWLISCIQRIPSAVKAGFPIQSSLLFGKLALCILPIEIIKKIPDIYGFEPIIGFIKFMAVLYCGFIAAIYLLRILIPFDLEHLYTGRHIDDVDISKEYNRAWGAGSMLYIIWLLNAGLFKYDKYSWCFFVLGVFFSLSYILMPWWKGKPFAPARLIPVPAILATFTALSYFTYTSGAYHQASVFFLVAAVSVISTIIIYLYWKTIRNQRDAAHPDLPRGSKFRSWFNFFAVPVIKMYFMIYGFYFILMFYTLNPVSFAVAVAGVTAAVFFHRYLRRSAPPFMRPGIFVAYIFLLWISITYVQSYNRMAPPPSACSKLTDNSYRHCLLPMKQYGKIEYLSGALPYDTIMDNSENALFVTFKNLSGYGAVVKIDTRTEKIDKHIITSNDRFPGKMLYPERLCIDRKIKRLYSTTKSMNNFQILDFDYSKGGFRLAERIKFPNYEVTSCETDTSTGDIFVIFLGPPDSRIVAIDGKTLVPDNPIRFGEFGYADYFTLDPAGKKIVSPSLDPKRLFNVYVVKEPRGRYMEIEQKPMRLPIRLPGGLKIAIPVPTFGIAADNSKNKFYFTCPFLRLVFETDGKDFHITKTMFAGKFPRKLAFNAKQHTLLVANYSSGTVDMIDTDSWKKIRTVEVGKLVRSVRVDDETGKNFATTACGVFELKGK